jgi:hypothetical protein
VASDLVVSRLVTRLAADAPRALKGHPPQRGPAPGKRAWELADDAAPAAGAAW